MTVETQQRLERNAAQHARNETAPISVRDLVKSWNGAPPVLSGVGLKLDRGRIHGVLGASGAGKSTLLRCIARLEQPNAGSIHIEGIEWTTLSPSALRAERQKLGIVFQHLGLLSSRTAAQNVALPLELSGAKIALREARVHELLGWFGVADKADEYPARLSGGQRQRVALARALATAPRILLADEPTSALDPESKDAALNTLLRIRDELRVSILLITHDLSAARAVCDEISILDQGRIVETGQTARVIEHPESNAARRLFTNVWV